MRAMIFSHIENQMSCKRSGSIYAGGVVHQLQAPHGAVAEGTCVRTPLRDESGSHGYHSSEDQFRVFENRYGVEYRPGRAG